mmetsp:Transcript_16053/g.38004  ORF Transcript_16053/g.38004 Transcript_16053/m.38004 type:complete len:157 (+) Transcript_16053:42-512(+)
MDLPLRLPSKMPGGEDIASFQTLTTGDMPLLRQTSGDSDDSVDSIGVTQSLSVGSLRPCGLKSLSAEHGTASWPMDMKNIKDGGKEPLQVRRQNSFRRSSEPLKLVILEEGEEETVSYSARSQLEELLSSALPDPESRRHRSQSPGRGEGGGRDVA